MKDYKLELGRALQLADMADKISMRHFRADDLDVTAKPDSSPVTQADLEIEGQLWTLVADTWHEGYLGEEGARAKSSGRLWIVDPIDGTRNFLRGMPIWGTLIALTENGETIAAAVSAPALGRRWWAAKDLGAWTKDVNDATRKLRVSSVRKIENAFLLTGSLYKWEQVPTGVDRVLRLIKTCWRHRALGDFFNHMLIAEGAADVCVEADPKSWDLTAPALIIQEAGGSIWTAATPETPASAPRIAITSNGHLEQAVRTALKL